MNHQEWPRLRENVLSVVRFLDELIHSTNNNPDIVQIRTTFRDSIRGCMDETIKELRKIAFCFYRVAENFQDICLWKINPVRDDDRAQLDQIDKILQRNLTTNRDAELTKNFQNQIELVSNREKKEKMRITYQCTEKANEILKRASELFDLNSELNIDAVGLGNVEVLDNTLFKLELNLKQQVLRTLKAAENAPRNELSYQNFIDRNILINQNLDDRNDLAISIRYQGVIQESNLYQEYNRVLQEFYSNCFLLADRMIERMEQYYSYEMRA